MNKAVTVIGAGLLVAGAAFAAMHFMAEPEDAGIKLVTPSAQELVKDSSRVLVDIRRPDEWQETGIVDGTLLVTYDNAERFLSMVRPHLAPGQTLAIMCRTDSRTRNALKDLSGRVDFHMEGIGGGLVRLVDEGYTPVSSKEGRTHPEG